jgi:hypothetical protein
MMAKANGQDAAAAPVLAVGLGRGSSGKSTGLSELIWRARNQGRGVIVADGDLRSRTLSGLFPDATRPETEEMVDIKNWFNQLLNAMAREKTSCVLDLGGGDRALKDYGRDLRLVEFCQRRGIEPVAIYFLGPDPEDLSHIVSIWDGGYFKPARNLLIMNEGTLKGDTNPMTAFDRTMSHPDFQRIVSEGAKPIMMLRLACMDLVKGRGVGFYAAAMGEGDSPLDPVEEFQVGDWLEDLERKRKAVGALSWLP